MEFCDILFPLFEDWWYTNYLSILLLLNSDSGEINQYRFGSGTLVIITYPMIKYWHLSNRHFLQLVLVMLFTAHWAQKKIKIVHALYCQRRALSLQSSSFASQSIKFYAGPAGTQDGNGYRTVVGHDLDTVLSIFRLSGMRGWQSWSWSENLSYGPGSGWPIN